MVIGLVAYGAGNVRSVRNAVSRLGVSVVPCATPEELDRTDKVIFPGVGEARTAMDYLSLRGIDRWLSATTRPVLGICLGMQVMYAHSDERRTTCLGITEGTVKRFEGIKTPHMGWNRVAHHQPSPLFEGIPSGEHFYFAHSYFALPTRDCFATTTYGGPVACAVRAGTYWGVQFHPERSGAAGLMLLRNFIERC